MARFKPVHRGLKLLPVAFDKQLQPSRFEHALCYLIEHEDDLARFHARYRNDREGAPADNPAAAPPEDRDGSKGSVRLSNRTDNEATKACPELVEGMATGQGVIEGYTGVAMVDEAAQVIVEAQAHGTGPEQAG
ncbi:MAG: hypothetical protein ACSLE5_01880 [Porticoccaceae bacterium]